MLPADSCGLPEESKAQAEQVGAIAVDRISGRAGLLPEPLLSLLDDALLLHLDLI